MRATVASAAPARALNTAHLEPDAALVRTVDGWRCIAAKAAFTAAVTLEPGWYRFRLKIRSTTGFAVRKRAEIAFEAADATGRAVSKDALAWNRTLDERFLVELPRATTRFTLTLVHAREEFVVEAFAVTRIPNPLVAVAAVREKLRLVWQYNCLRPVLLRGGGLLLRGKFRDFGSKVLKGLADSRVMRGGGYKANEADAAWWRRNALPSDEAERVREACDAMTDPPPLAVLLPVDPERFDEARAAARSVRRQLYPHWELLLACAGDADLHPHLERIIGRDSRVKVALVDPADGLAAALAQLVGGTDCERLVVLPPSIELAEHALYHLATATRDTPTADGVSVRVYTAVADGAADARVWMTRTARLGDAGPKDLSPASLGDWACGGLDADRRRDLDRVLAYPVEDAPLLAKAQVGKAGPRPVARLSLAGDLRGLSGWDHVTYALLRGLPSAGVDVSAHPISYIARALLPPAFVPTVRRPRAGTKQLAIAPPFLAHRSKPTSDTALFTMWETDELPAACVATLNKCGLVIVPSRWQVDCFRACGVRAPLAVAPLGFDRLVYHPDGTFPDVCTFGTAGALAAGGVRKNAQKMIDLFRATFPTEPDVRLRVKVSPNSPHVATHDDPRIDLIRVVLPNTQLAAWYRSLTAYLNGSFGEGFGLHLIEAMACGRPLITADYSGLTAFFDPSVGYAVAHTLVPVSNDIYTGRWAEPSGESLAARMRQVYADREEAKRLGAAAAARAAGFTWKSSGRALVRVLREHGFLTETTPRGEDRRAS